MAPAALQEMLHEPFRSCPLCLSSAAPPSRCRAVLCPASWHLSCLPPSTPITVMASCWGALAGPSPTPYSRQAQPVPLPRTGAL